MVGCGVEKLQQELHKHEGACHAAGPSGEKLGVFADERSQGGDDSCNTLMNLWIAQLAGLVECLVSAGQGEGFIDDAGASTFEDALGIGNGRTRPDTSGAGTIHGDDRIAQHRCVIRVRRPVDGVVSFIP